MRVVVTGASGFVGPRLIAEFARHGHIGVAVARKQISLLPLGWSSSDRSAILKDDMSARTSDWVVHLEVKQHVDAPTERERQEFRDVNVEGTRTWLRWCTRNEVNGFAYFSTIKAVGESNSVQNEDAEGAPSTPYGQSKREAENLVRAWTVERPGRRALILRPAVIYGPGNRANVYAMVRGIDRKRFFLVGRNDNVKSLVSIANVAAAVPFLMARAETGAAVYNLVDPESYSVRESARMIAAQLGKRGVPSMPLTIARAAMLLGEVVRKTTGRALPLTRSRLKALTETTHFSAGKLIDSGFIHPQTTEAGLREMVEWYQKTKS